MTDKLKPCPFCGGKAKFILVGNVVGHIKCSECHIYQGFLHPIGVATDLWNGRADNDR